MTFIGIDISKQTFDHAFERTGVWHQAQLLNSIKGYKKLAKQLDKQCDIVVMEASGPYYMPLACWFYEQGFNVVVANPLSVKRFAQMRMMRTKTDKKDAQLIAQWAAYQEILPFWEPPSDTSHRMRQTHTAIELLNKQIRQTKNQIESLSSTGLAHSGLIKRLKRIVKTLEKEKTALEDELLEICQSTYGDLMELIQSIPGVGPKTAVLLIAVTDGFRKFTHYKQLIAYIGLSPRIVQSGTSVKGKGHICKMGNAQVRKMLYMCTWTAKSVNRQCKQMYERLKNKGKAEKVIKVALANKLIKQIFAIAKSGKKYDENYQPNICL